MPFVAWLWTVTSDSIGILLPEIPAPLPNRLIGDANSASKHRTVASTEETSARQCPHHLQGRRSFKVTGADLHCSVFANLSRLDAQLVAVFSRCSATSKLDENSIVDAKAT